MLRPVLAWAASMNLAAFGITADLPEGWEGRIVRRDTDLRLGPTQIAQFAPDEHTYPIAQFANFALPPDVADYGSGAVELMGRDNLFVTLLEFGPESVGQPLFAGEGLPLPLEVERFSPSQLQRTIAGQGGFQTFFTASGRPFCLFIALGSYANRAVLVPRADEVLASVEIEPR